MRLCGIFSIVLVDSKTFLVHLATKVISGQNDKKLVCEL